MNTEADLVILVDENDNEIGVASKLLVHQHNLLHRAFSIFIFKKNECNEWEVLLQQRAAKKYHSPMLWTNACCSHPRPNETIITAAKRRLNEELGLRTDLTEIGSFIYQADFPNALSENEFDHVLIGIIDRSTTFIINQDEVENICWMTLDATRQAYHTTPHSYTRWFKEAFEIAARGLK